MKHFFSILDAAQYLGLAKQTLYNMTSKGSIPFYRKPGGRKLYFLEDELEAWIKTGKNPQDVEPSEVERRAK